MSRIRSIHPGFFTDENVVSVSMEARLCVLGLGIEADDKGVFEWKPKRLKMRLFPADAVDMVTLLDELVSENLIMRYEIDGKEYGAIRNFRKFQRPKTPNDLHPAPDHIRNYVGLEVPVSEKMPSKQPQFPLLGEKSPQMEDEGGRRRKSSEAKASAAAPPEIVPTAIDVQRAIFDTGVAILTATGSPDRDARSMLGKWRKDYGDSAVLTALSKCQVERPEVPIEWITGALKFEKGKANGQQRQSGNRGGSTRDAAQLALARMGNR